MPPAFVCSMFHRSSSEANVVQCAVCQSVMRLQGATIRKHLTQNLEKVPGWECFFVHRVKVVFLSEDVDDKKR